MDSKKEDINLDKIYNNILTLYDYNQIELNTEKIIKQQIKQFIEIGGNINKLFIPYKYKIYNYRYYTTLLHTVVWCNSYNLIKYLLDNGANPNINQYQLGEGYQFKVLHIQHHCIV